MGEHHHQNDWEEQPDKPESQESFPIADVVSVQTLANILIRKGICTPDELYEEEQRRRREAVIQQSTPFVPTRRRASSARQRSHDRSNHRHRKSGWLKRKMSKRRWTRRLGRALFGWEWKKIKTNRGEQDLETPQE